jgi:hypothetical protein
MDISSVEAASCDALPSVFEVTSSLHMLKKEELAHFREEVSLHNQQRQLSVIVSLMFDFIPDLLITLNHVHFLSVFLSHTHTPSLSLPSLLLPTFKQQHNSQIVHNSALKAFLLSYLAHRERPPLFEKDGVETLNKKGNPVIAGNVMAEFDKKVIPLSLLSNFLFVLLSALTMLHLYYHFNFCFYFLVLSIANLELFHFVLFHFILSSRILL